MPKDPNVSFSKLVDDVFNSVIHDYHLNCREENTRLLIASKEELELVFRLEAIPLFYYFSLELKLSGNLAEQATSDTYYRGRGLGVSAIAQCLDINYKPSIKGAQTESELRELLETGRDELLKYCKDILLGDVSSWQVVVECLKKKREKKD